VKNSTGVSEKGLENLEKKKGKNRGVKQGNEGKVRRLPGRLWGRTSGEPKRTGGCIQTPIGGGQKKGPKNELRGREVRKKQGKNLKGQKTEGDKQSIN